MSNARTAGEAKATAASMFAKRFILECVYQVNGCLGGAVVIMVLVFAHFLAAVGAAVGGAVDGSLQPRDAGRNRQLLRFGRGVAFDMHARDGGVGVVAHIVDGAYYLVELGGIGRACREARS